MWIQAAVRSRHDLHQRAEQRLSHIHLARGEKISTSPAHCAKKKKPPAEEEDGECGGASMLGRGIHLLKDKGRDRRGWELGLGEGVGVTEVTKWEWKRVKRCEQPPQSELLPLHCRTASDVERIGWTEYTAAHTSLVDLCPLPKVPYLPHACPCCIPDQLARRRADVSPARLNLRRPSCAAP